MNYDVPLMQSMLVMSNIHLLWYKINICLIGNTNQELYLSRMNNNRSFANRPITERQENPKSAKEKKNTPEEQN